MTIPDLLCVAAILFNGTHATDERVFARPAETDGRSQDKSSYSYMEGKDHERK